MLRIQRPVGFAILLATILLGGLSIAGAVRRAVLDRVTLRVHDRPLHEVLRRISRQTRESVVGHPQLNSRVSLDARDMPLEEVLDRLATQTGALWRRNLAVHVLPSSLRTLRDSLAAGESPNPALWTHASASASPPHLAFPPSDSTSPPTGSDSSRRRRVAIEVEDVVNPPQPPGETTNPAGPNSAPDGDSRRRTWVRANTLEPGGRMVSIDLSPLRVLVETPLLPKFRAAPTSSPDEEETRRLARSIDARVGVVYSLEPSPLPEVPAELRRSLRVARGKRGGGLVPASPPPAIQDLAARAESEMRRAQFDRLNELTPERRARLAAEDRRHAPLETQAPTP